ncbi:hypothetical protein P8452_33556 [Trifolium repens]|nr:hypothetical protein P8452_33556 [Trifolium repens]
MEHYAIHLRCSPIPSLSYSTKRYEDAITRGSKFNLKFNHATIFHPQFTTSHKVARSISHTNCMINSFSVPNSKNSEGNDNKILRGINGASLIFCCILGMFNFSSMMMNYKFNMAYATEFPRPIRIVVGGENSFDSMWKTITADPVESNTYKHNPQDASSDEKKMHALYLRKRGDKDAIKNMVDELTKDLEKFKDFPDREFFARRALIELLLIQESCHEENYCDARKLLDEKIDEYISTYPNPKTVKHEEKSTKLTNIYAGMDDMDPEKQSMADIFLFKAILHTKLKDKEAAKWWEAFAKTLITK